MPICAYASDDSSACICAVVCFEISVIAHQVWRMLFSENPKRPIIGVVDRRRSQNEEAAMLPQLTDLSSFVCQ